MHTKSGLAVFCRSGVGIFLGFACSPLVAPTPVRAQGALVVYCSVEEEWCRGMTTAFERQTGIKVAMTRRSSGETYAQLKAEAANPRGVKVFL
jgi:iron(III) transport system substrate-binding protein